MIGALMIGGISERMGSPKSMISKGGVTLGHYLCQLLEDLLGKPPLLVGQGPVDAALDGLVSVPDLVPGAGPLSGLLGLFQYRPHEDFLVLATDLYAMDLQALSWLLSQQSQTTAPFIWPRFPQRAFGEPLASIYRAPAAAVLKSAWEKGVRGPVRAVPGELKFEPEIPPDQQKAFANVNRPEDLLRLKQARDC